MKNIVKVVAVVMAIAIVACVLASCGKLLTGTYKSDSLVGSYVQYTFSVNKVVIDTFLLGTLATSTEATYKIADGKITFTYTETGDGTTSKRESTESFSQDGDTITIGGVTYTKSK